MSEERTKPAALDRDAVRSAVAAAGWDWAVAAEPFSDYPFPVASPAAVTFQRRGRRRFRLRLFAAAPPPSRDWRNGHALSPPLDQGDCNTCTAFAITGLMSDLWELKHPGAGRRLSAGHVHWCIGGVTCMDPLDGSQTLTRLKSTKAATAASGDYPFDPVQCPATSGLMGIGAFWDISTTAAAKAALGAGPIYAVMALYEDFWKFYEGGIYRRAAGRFLNAHSIVIVGYDDPGGYWIIRNSRGPAWGEGGYARVAYGECEIFGLYGGFEVRI